MLGLPLGAVHSIARMAPIFASAPDDDEALVQIQTLTRQINAVLLIQNAVRQLWRLRLETRAEAEALDDAAVAIQTAVRGKSVRGWSSHAGAYPGPELEADALPEVDGDEDAAGAFTVRNLDTGEASTVFLNAEDVQQGQLPALLSLGSVQRGTSSWEAVRLESRGLLEKLATKSTLSFRSYQLCVWQERYVFAEDNALCYQQLSLDHTPTGKCKRIPYSSLQFVGPYDETQFVIKCSKRTYTFLCPSTEARTRWIKNISMLAGCSASTEVCRHTTRGAARR